MASSVYLLATLDRLTEPEITALFQVQSFTERPALFNTFYLLDLAAPAVYLGLSWFLLRRHWRQIANHYSYRESVDYRWLRHLVIGMAVAWSVIDLPLLGSLLIEPLVEQQSLVIGFSVATLLIFYLGFHGFRQATVYAAATNSSATTPRPTAPPVSGVAVPPIGP